MHAPDHLFDIEFTCSKCDEVQYLTGKISSILGDIHEFGWPICPECGDDMEESVVS